MSEKIVVLGAAVIDNIYTVDKLPAWGEGVHADSFASLPGGKGFNQAIAAARLGANVDLISIVGADSSGRTIIDALEQNQVSHKYVWPDPRTQTPVINLFVNPQ